MKLSACMIVKNEEHCLERCLKSIKNLVDEIVIVDTGSTDKTIEIAKKYTDKIFHHEWENNFSLHRNQSIDYATGDWLLIIDADEELKAEITRELLEELFGKVPPDINSLAVLMEDLQRNKIVMRCNSARLFRKGKVKYVGRVHNQPVMEGPSAVVEGITIYHYGYDFPKHIMKAKFKRSRDLLLKQYENKETDHSEFYLCQLHGQYKMLEESQKWGELYYKKREELGDQFNQTTYFTLVKSYIDTGNMERAWEIIGDFLNLKKPDPDMALAISDFGAKESRLDIVGIGARKYLEDVNFYRENPARMGGKFFFSMRDDVEALVLYRLCMVTFNEGIESWKRLEKNLHYLTDDIQEELKSNFNKLGLSFLLKDNNYNLPLLKAI